MQGGKSCLIRKIKNKTRKIKKILKTTKVKMKAKMKTSMKTKQRTSKQSLKPLGKIA